MADSATIEDITDKLALDQTSATGNLQFLVNFPCELAPAGGADAEATHTADYYGKHKVPCTPHITGMWQSKDGTGFKWTVSSMVFTTEHQACTGEYKVKVTWTPDGASTPETIELTRNAGDQVNSPGTVQVSVAHPRLGMMLQSALGELEKASAEDSTPGWAASLSPTKREEMLANIVSHVFEGLRRGLGYLWRREGGSCCTTGGVALRDANLSNDLHTDEDWEECWAQHFSEMFVGAPYGAGGPAMDAPYYTAAGATRVHAQDAWVFQQYVKNPAGPVHPIRFACQQLATMGLLTRGHTVLADNPLGATGNTVQSDVTGHLPGKRVWAASPLNPQFNPHTVPAERLVAWQDQDSPQGAFLAERGFGYRGTDFSASRLMLRPGTCFWGHLGIPHVAVLLRAIKNEKVLQLADTGAWIFDNDYEPLGGLRDTTFRPRLTASTTNYEGVMVPPDSPDLPGAIATMRRSRPLGVARLVVGERNWAQDKTDMALLYWVSQWVPMVLGDEGLSISRFIAALRGCPYAEKLDVRWQFAMPANRATLEAAVAGTPYWWVWTKTHQAGLVDVREVSVTRDGIPTSGRSPMRPDPTAPNDPKKATPRYAEETALQRILRDMTTDPPVPPASSTPTPPASTPTPSQPGATPSPPPLTSANFPKLKGLWNENVQAKHAQIAAYFSLRARPPAPPPKTTP